MLQYSTVTPTNRSFEDIRGLLFSLSQQTILPKKIIVLYDKKISVKEQANIKTQCMQYKTIVDRIVFVTEHTDTNFTVWKGASRLRNYGFSLVNTPLVLAVDDDNEFDIDFCEKLLSCYETCFDNKDWILQPLEEYRKSGKLRFTGYSWFSPFRVRPKKITYNATITKPYISPIAPSNCFLGATKLFLKYPFVEKLKFVYEDFLFFAVLSKHGYPVHICPSVRTHHMMSPRTKLQNLYIDTPERAFQKMRNKSILMKEIASPLDLLIYYSFGWWLQSGRSGLHVLIFASRRKKLPLCRAIIRGSVVGLLTKSNL